jgi:hypothetical protein
MKDSNTESAMHDLTTYHSYADEMKLAILNFYFELIVGSFIERGRDEILGRRLFRNAH